MQFFGILKIGNSLSYLRKFAVRRRIKWNNAGQVANSECRPKTGQHGELVYSHNVHPKSYKVFFSHYSFVEENLDYS